MFVDDVELMCMQCGGYVDDMEVMCMLCGCYVDDMDPYCGCSHLHVHIYILDESLSYPVSSPIVTVLNSMHCFIYVSHGPNQDYYATENCLITQGDKKYV